MQCAVTCDKENCLVILSFLFCYFKGKQFQGRQEPKYLKEEKWCAQVTEEEMHNGHDVLSADKYFTSKSSYYAMINDLIHFYSDSAMNMYHGFFKRIP